MKPIAATNSTNATKATNRTIRVQVVAEPTVAAALEQLIQTARPRFEVAGSCTRAADCIEQLKKAMADVALVDLDGDEGAGGLAELFAQTRVKLIAIGGSSDATLQDDAVLAGARAVVEKPDLPAKLLAAIEKVHAGELCVDRAVTNRIFLELARQGAAKHHSPEQNKIASLTPRERQSIAAVASDANAPGRVIAERLNMSEDTLHGQLTSVYGKLAVTNRLALFAYAHQHGLNELG